MTCDLFSDNGEYHFRDWERRFAPATSSDANIYEYETTDYSTKECDLRSGTLYLSPLFNSGVDQNPYNSIIERDGVDGCRISETEDLEVQMDLTDDLLHMVFAVSMF